MKVYPIFLNNLRGKKCVIFGGNHEAERKVFGLLECDADVIVYSEDVTPTLKEWSEQEEIKWVKRWYKEGDLKGVFLSIVAITDHEATKPIWTEAERENVLLNAMDDVPHCNFVAGSVVKQGPLVLSISTSGAAPALSVRLRQEFSERFGVEYNQFLLIMKSLRPHMAARYPDFEIRRQRWYAIVDSEILSLLKQNREVEACSLLKEILGFSENVCMRQDSTCACQDSIEITQILHHKQA